ncbi:hypothetical protein L484_021352 [Morus notabilis]|uniref:LysM domain-containing protein n=1 Tax=Morus notabilis TaxID=981085 RepID=W9RHB7_9ROSA|nr:hypothetical protein L484_021352 [Morus notabilis]
MSDPQSASAGDANDNALAKTAGFVVFSGIVMSILKALTPLPKITTEPQPLAESTQQINIPPKEPLLKVSIDAIKEANGLTGDTIYAGKKLIIPLLYFCRWSLVRILGVQYVEESGFNVM